MTARPSAPRGFALLAVASLTLLAGCSSGTGASSTAGATAGTSTAAAPTAGTGAPQLTGSITVLAAASLTGTFTTLAHQFEAAHPGTTITLSFGASSALAAQVTAGAPADVFASANTPTMAIVTKAGDTTSAPQTFATNVLEIAVPPGNPGKVTGLADFATSSLRIALCAPAVPCGSAAVKLLRDEGVTAKPDTLETDVKEALAKVELGEVDAALVYRTDVASAGAKVTGIEVPGASKVVNTYPIATLKGSSNSALAQAFVAQVLSPAGQAVLTAAGFSSK